MNKCLFTYDSSNYTHNLSQLRLIIENTLKDIGISEKLKGFNCIREAVLLNVIYEEDILRRKLYHKLAPIFSVTPMTIEKRIDYAVKSIKVNENTHNHFIRLIPSNHDKNSFILTVSNYVGNYYNNNLDIINTKK